jgi:hypothetical protein
MHFTTAHLASTAHISPRKSEAEVGTPSMLRTNTLQLIQLKLQRDILAALGAVKVGKAAARDGHVLAHVDAPGVIGIAGEEAVGADFNGVGPVRWV